MSVLTPSSSSFIHLAEHRRVVDKSLAIKSFCEYTTQSIHLQLWPRRCGKTTMLDMFRTFLERTSPAEITLRKALFQQNDLAIVKDPCFEREFGRYPVIYLDLSNVIGSSMVDMLGQFQECVVDVHQRLEECGFLRGSVSLNDHQQKFLKDLKRECLQDHKWSKALCKLVKIVHSLTRKKVVVLVDEYDTPTSYALRQGYFHEANLFFRNVFSSLLKNNDNIRCAMLVGILKVSKAGWLAGVNNIEVFPYGGSLYPTACMFTENETRSLYDKQSQSLHLVGQKLQFTFDDLAEWYNGYYTLDGQKLYNPWSVGLALTVSTLGCYWVESGYDSVILQCIHHMLDTDNTFREQFEYLLTSQSVQIQLDEDMAYTLVSDMSTMQLWTLMYFAGYLTRVPTSHTDREDDNSDGSDPDSDNNDNSNANSSNSISATLLPITVCLPNREIYTLFRKWLNNHMVQRMATIKGLPIRSVDLFRNMVSGSMSSFAKGFANLVWTTMPAEFLGGKEYVYQSFVCGFFFAAGDASKCVSDVGSWEVEVERCAGIGRLDLIVQCRGDAAGSIHEHKRISLTKKDRKEGYGDSQCRRLTTMAETALKQLETKQYRAKMRPHVTELREYGIAFLGPYCAVVGRLLKRQRKGQWVIHKLYTSTRDEKRRTRLYNSRSP